MAIWITCARCKAGAAGLLPDLLAATQTVRDQQHLLIRVA
jgi:hypothetical protein